MLIDFHTHCFPPKVAEKAIPHLAAICGQTPLTDGTFDDTREKMRAWGVDRFLALNIATAPKQQTNVNNFAASIDKTPARVDSKACHDKSVCRDDSICRDNTACRGNDVCRALGSVHAAAPDALEELQRVKDLGLPGVKLHPDYQGVEMDDKTLLEVYDLCSQWGMFCVFHAGFDPVSPDVTRVIPQKALEIHKQFPRLKMVLAHMGGFARWDEVEEFLVGTGVYFDTSLAPAHMPPEQALRIIQNHGAERVLFGSDCPWGSPEEGARYIDGLPLTSAQKDRIFAENALELLK